MLGLQTHSLDFEILPSSNDKVLLFLDESQYFERPESPLLKIVPPGYSKFFQVNIEASKINVLNSHLIGFTEVLESDCIIPLPDGIWHLTYMICPYKYLQKDKYHLRINALNKQINAIYKYYDSCEDNTSCTRKDIIDIYILIESAKANVEAGNLSKGAKDFSLAQDKTKKLLKQLERTNYAMQYV